MTKQTSTWQERFKELFVEKISPEGIDFIATERDAARLDERRKILALLVDEREQSEFGGQIDREARNRNLLKRELRTKIEQMGEV